MLNELLTRTRNRKLERNKNNEMATTHKINCGTYGYTKGLDFNKLKTNLKITYI